MKPSVSKQRKRDNEAVFRRYNERVEKGFVRLRRLAKAEGHESLVSESDTPLFFYCECSDETCKKRVPIAPSAYQRIHINRCNFTIFPGHAVRDIERIVSSEAGYEIVEKYEQPPETVATLRKTDTQNS